MLPDVSDPVNEEPDLPVFLPVHPEKTISAATSSSILFFNIRLLIL
jgi:hypothetical protein